MKTELTYGQALEAVKTGKLISRDGWNGKGMFVFMRPADDLPIPILMSAKSLPNSIKDFFEKKHRLILPDAVPTIHFSAYLCMKAADDSIVNGWLASQTDMLAADWCILN